MDQQNKKAAPKPLCSVSSRKTLRDQCIPTRPESEVLQELEEYVKTYQPAMDLIQHKLTHAPSKGILKRSSYCQRAVDSPERTQEDFNDDEELPNLFPSIKDSLEILLKKKSSISARKSILKKPSRSSDMALPVDILHTSDDDELSPVAKFPAKDSMEMLIKKSKSCVRMSDSGDKVKTSEEDDAS